MTTFYTVNLIIFILVYIWSIKTAKDLFKEHATHDYFDVDRFSKLVLIYLPFLNTSFVIGALLWGMD